MAPTFWTAVLIFGRAKSNSLPLPHCHAQLIFMTLVLLGNASFVTKRNTLSALRWRSITPHPSLSNSGGLSDVKATPMFLVSSKVA